MTDALLTAEKLLEIGAVKLSTDQPFTWSSGWKSPIYCDNRKILSHPYIRDFIKSELCNVVFEKFGSAEVIAGVATAGIPWGAMVADQLKLSLVYVRPQPKAHGLGNQIEGELKSGQRVVVLEDLISTGKSSLAVIEVLKAQNVSVEGMVSIFDYDFAATKELITRAGIILYSLTNYTSLLATAQNKGAISATQFDLLLKWRQDPSNWGKAA
jgi:orotate phosphoribosyltransferase